MSCILDTDEPYWCDADWNCKDCPNWMEDKEVKVGMTKEDDNVKKQLLDKLLEEPTMVLSTAYVYAKNYVEYGEDITKAWTTAVQQASVIQKVRQKAWVEAYDRVKADYEARLKADMIAMLTEIQLEIQKFSGCSCSCSDGVVDDIDDLIQQKIDALKVVKDENNSIT